MKDDCIKVTILNGMFEDPSFKELLVNNKSSRSKDNENKVKKDDNENEVKKDDIENMSIEN